MAIAQVFEGTWEELARHRERYGDQRLMLMILPDPRTSLPESEIIPAEKPRPRFGSGKGVFRMTSDFDAPLEDFKEYME